MLSDEVLEVSLWDWDHCTVCHQHFSPRLLWYPSAVLPKKNLKHLSDCDSSLLKPQDDSLFQSGVEIPAWSGSITSSIISCPSHVSTPLVSLVFVRHTPASGGLPVLFLLSVLFPLPGKLLSHLSGFPQVSSSLKGHPESPI